MTAAVTGLALLNAVAFSWALAPLLRTTPLERRARRLGRRPVAAALPGDDPVTAWSEALASRLPPMWRARAAAAASAAGWGDGAAPRLLAATVLLTAAVPLGALLLTELGALRLALLALAGGAAPWLHARNAALRRRQALARGLPDALDLLVICADSGLTLDAALARSGRELAPARPAIAAELAATAVELGFLPRRADAFDNLARRVPLPAVRALADTLVQTERFGTPLATALSVMAEESRTARLLAAEARAARLPALMTVPMIGFVLPPLFVILIGPAVISAVS